MPTKRVYVRCGLLGLLLAVFGQPVFAGEEAQRATPAKKGTLTMAQRPKGDNVEVVVTWVDVSEPMLLAIAIGPRDDPGMPRKLKPGTQELLGLVLVRSVEKAGSDSFRLDLMKIDRTFTASAYLTDALDVCVLEDKYIKGGGNTLTSKELRHTDCRPRFQLLGKQGSRSIEAIPGSETMAFQVPKDGFIEVWMPVGGIEGSVRQPLVSTEKDK